MVSRSKGWAVATMLVALPLAVAHGQDAAPGQGTGIGTPPELRDFRLDSPPPRPVQEPTTAPQPATQPSTITQPQPATTSDQNPDRPVANDRSIAPERPSRDAGVAPVAPSSVAPADIPDSEPTTQPDLPMPPAESDVADRPFDQPAPAPVAGKSDRLYWVSVGASLLLALFAAIFFWRRRKANNNQFAVQNTPAEQPSPPARLDKATPTAPLPEPDSLSVRFAPTGAQLSIASLTVTGQLTVENRSRQLATDLALRSQMISAQDQQREAIETFHQNRSDGESQPLGDLAAGERIDAIVEIRLPRDELHAFRWTEREFVAPIVLVNVAGSIDGQPVEARLSQLIGREGAGSSERMKPLAIDRGPRRFTGIGARPVIA